MVPGTASLQLVVPFTDTDPLSIFPQVPLPNLKSKAFRKKSLCLATASSAVGSAESSAQKNRNPFSTNKIKPQRTVSQRRDLQSLSELVLLRQSHGEQTCSQNDESKQDSQRLRESSGRQAQTKPKKDVGLDQWRNPLYLDPPTHLQRGAHISESADVGSSHAQESFSTDHTAYRHKKARLPKLRGSKHSSRGFDVMDDLMSSHGRGSKALLESLQVEVAREKDEMMNFGRDYADDSQTGSSLDMKAPAGKFIRGNQGGGVSQMSTESGKLRRWQPVHEEIMEDASTSTAFASSIEKALSPPVVAKSNTAINDSTGNVIVVQQSSPSSLVEDVSDTVQPALRGQEVLWALQKAALEKAKQKQKIRKANDRVPKGKEVASLHDNSDWRNAKPIVLKPEWALEIDNLERRIERLKFPTL